MTDQEWNSWQSNWTEASGPLPDVRARVLREVVLHRVGKVAFVALILFTLAVALPAVAASPEPEVRWIGWLIVAFFGAMSLGYALIQRGIEVERTGNPRDALAFLHRRLRVERLTAHLVRWVYAALCIAFVFIFPRLVEHHEKPWLEKAISYPWMLVVFAVTFSAPWWVGRRNRKYQDELDRWRRWMDEQEL